MPVACLSMHAEYARGSGCMVPARSFPAAGGASACGFGELYGPVRGCPRDRRRGSLGARTYSGQRRRREYHARSFPQVRAHVEVQAGAVCKTVGSVYVGSNPTPATTCENGPWAAETRPAGPFPSRHAMYQGVSPWVDAWQCPRTLADSVRAKLAVRITARFGDPCRFVPLPDPAGLFATVSEAPGRLV